MKISIFIFNISLPYHVIDIFVVSFDVSGRLTNDSEVIEELVGHRAEFANDGESILLSKVRSSSLIKEMVCYVT